MKSRIPSIRKCFLATRPEMSSWMAMDCRGKLNNHDTRIQPLGKSIVFSHFSLPSSRAFHSSRKHKSQSTHFGHFGAADPQTLDDCPLNTEHYQNTQQSFHHCQIPSRFHGRRQIPIFASTPRCARESQ